MNELFSWSLLTSFTGAVAATTILTQFFKTIFAKLPTQLLSYFVACAVMLLSTAATATGTVLWETWALIPLNAVLVSLSSNGTYVGIQRLMSAKKE